MYAEDLGGQGNSGRVEEGVGLGWEFEFAFVAMLPDIFKLTKLKTTITSPKKPTVVSAPITKYLKRFGVGGPVFGVTLTAPMGGPVLIRIMTARDRQIRQ